ncbi:hypothetical protein F751_4900 [Auxenochlorella protothecoides]|uniref:Uncharacterized protein n=1 Tax=Auxenochlorella protothecoides TaxID=3075 RepID=A0A087SL03_AUXPR|nr:hypothetical protein F751_4900 [Auxenochlorella protothecoides]KFM26407.1 hypothetical protein F751_4900 [Auxenochlorella protothecoides]
MCMHQRGLRPIQEVRPPGPRACSHALSTPAKAVTASQVVVSHTATVPAAPPAATSIGASAQKPAENTAPTLRSWVASRAGSPPPRVSHSLTWCRVFDWQR